MLHRPDTGLTSSESGGMAISSRGGISYLSISATGKYGKTGRQRLDFRARLQYNGSIAMMGTSTPRILTAERPRWVRGVGMGGAEYLPERGREARMRA